ncbi:MAG: uroporphyrinogen decarboxylase [Bacteroidetes bacterium]|nr:uroporphyrinogen decarboxylase [Bacteroidota bacterium]
MDNRQLVIDTLNHKEREIVPYQLDLSAEMEEKVIQALGPDFLSQVDNCFAIERNEIFEKVDSYRTRDMFGAVWLLDQKGDFGIVENCQIPEPALQGYDFPLPDEQTIRRKCERLVSKKNETKFKMYTIGFSLYERAWTLRGVENVLMDMILHPEFITGLLDRIVDYNMAVVKIAMEYPIDGIFFGDDWGQQKGLIMGPHYWREFIKPQLARQYQFVKDHGLYLCQHSCGDIQEVFPDLIEIGLDIYNTFQPEIYDVAHIKKTFGDQLTFYGGISTQHVLPFGTPAEVAEETKMMIDIMGRDGGYVAAPTHAMPVDIPVENMLAFLEVVRNQ